MEPRADSAMRAEILLQPEYVRKLALNRSWQRYDGRFAGHRPILTGCGTSYFAARLAAAQAAERGASVPAVQAFELLRSGKLCTHGDLIVALSHSGATAAVLDLLARAREEGVPSVLITGYPASEAAALADFVVDTGYPAERSWCHTISFTLAALTATQMLHALGPAFPAPPDPEEVALAIEAALAAEDEIAGAAARIASATSVWLLGAGPTEPLAPEFALKLSEAAYIPAVPLELEQFFHGYIPAVEGGSTVIAALPRNTRTRAGDLQSVARVVGFQLLEVSGLTGPLSDAALPFGQAAALQLLTHHVAMRRGTDPDRLRREDPLYLEARRAYR